MVRDLLKLWNRLQKIYDHMKIVVLPQTQYIWQLLRLQDYKSVADYNSTLFDIVTRLESCGVKISEADMLEKTFFTFHASNIILQQQYRQRNFTKYSELISVLLIVEKTNELLLKNHDLRPTGFTATLEAHVNSNKSLVILKVGGSDKVRVFEEVALDPTYIIEITFEMSHLKSGM